MLIYYYSKDQELKRKITIIDIILTIGILLILIVASEKTGKDFFCFMIFLTYCFFNITFSIVIYLLLKKGLN